MAVRPHRAILFALYQLSLFAGIALLPVAVVARQAGLELPVHRVVSRLGEAYTGRRKS
ncbi:MAG: hypothetical protein ABEH56_01525 [Salinirussus sp.]